MPVPVSVLFNGAPLIVDTAGSLFINNEGQKATFSAFGSFTAAAGDIAVISGATQKLVRVTRVEVSLSTSGTAAIGAITLVKRSTADTGGTSAVMASVPHDSADTNGYVVVLSYTAAPTLGTAIGTVRGVQFNDQSATTPGAATWLWTFGDGRAGAKAMILRGLNQQLCVNLGAAVSTQTATVSYEWTEE